MATQKTVNIQIAAADMATMKKAGYNLCFAKGVVDTSGGSPVFNVVWETFTPLQYLANNTFQWTPQFQVFGTNTFSTGTLVQAQTNIVDIGLGEQIILDTNGTFGNPSTGGASTSINLTNNFGPIHPGVNQLIVGQANPTPIYVAEQQIIVGTDQLTPVEQVMVWFEQNVQTQTMFSDAKSISIVIDLTSTNTETRLFQNGGWVTPGALMRMSDPVSLLNLALVTATVINGTLLASKIAAYLTGVYANLTVNVTVAGNNVTVQYSEKPGLSLDQVRLLSVLKKSSTPRDDLTVFALEALSDMSCEYTKLTAA